MAASWRTLILSFSCSATSCWLLPIPIPIFLADCCTFLHVHCSSLGWHASHCTYHHIYHLIAVLMRLLYSTSSQVADTITPPDIRFYLSKSGVNRYKWQFTVHVGSGTKLSRMRKFENENGRFRSLKTKVTFWGQFKDEFGYCAFLLSCFIHLSVIFMFFGVEIAFYSYGSSTSFIFFTRHEL